MSRRWQAEGPPPDAARLLRRLAERLERFLDGEELAFETLGEEIEDEGFTSDDLVSAILVLQRAAASLGAAGEAELESAEEGAPAGTPGRHAHRVASAEERELLSPEAWGYLIDLKRRGSLDDGQFERVLDILTRPVSGAGPSSQPAGVELAREVAARVALGGEGASLTEGMHGEVDRIH